MEKRMEEKFSREAELIKKYNINIGALKSEQLKLAKTLSIKDFRDYSDINLIAGIDSEFEGNKIISSVSVLTLDMEILYQEYSIKKLTFPYISGMRAYRELSSMIEAFNKLEEKPDIVFIKGHGITNPRLGLASHFSLSVNVPTIGVAESLLIGEVKGENIIVNEKIVGKVFISKVGSKPLYVSPGNLLSVETALELTKKFTIYPHKFPEPLHVAGKYGKKMRKELFSKQ